MKLSLLTLAALAALTAADSSIYRKKADGAFLEKQKKILKLFVGLGADEKTYDDNHVHFHYNKPELFQKAEALESFIKVYERGLLDKRGVFTLYCEKNRHDTFKLFDLFYFAKDFDTFYNIAYWARYELNPLQWGYAFSAAVFHRTDTRGIYIPPLYEIFPHFFVQNEIMHQAETAHSHGETYAKFEVNNTGWDWSWHADMLSGPYKSSPKWVGDDTEVRMSYFREDVGLANFLTYFNLKFAGWMSNEKYSDIHFFRRGEIFYAVYNWVKNRYNLERMVNGLPPVVPFETFEPVPGYNPRIQDNFGHTYLARDDKLVASHAVKDATWDLNQILFRIADIVDSQIVLDFKDKLQLKKLRAEGVNSFDEFAKIMFSIKDAWSRKYYKEPFYYYFYTIDQMVKAPNDREYTSTALGSFMTQTRDPAFYTVLASMDQWFDRFFYRFPAYTKEELSFPGVTFKNFELDRLDTFYERYDWELTNGINFAEGFERKSKKFEASQFRLNHKPFTYKIFIDSDKEAEVVVRLFLGPKRDVDGREYSFEQQRQAMIAFDIFRTKVKSGENVFERHSHQNGYYEDYQRFRPFYEKVNKSIDTNEPFYYNELWQCGAPQNLMIPRGWKSGKKFAIFAIVTKYDYQPPQDGYYPCHHNSVFDQHSVHFPLDRRTHYFDEFVQPNMFFSSVKIYHDDSVSNYNH